MAAFAPLLTLVTLISVASALSVVSPLLPPAAVSAADPTLDFGRCGAFGDEALSYAQSPPARTTITTATAPADFTTRRRQVLGLWKLMAVPVMIMGGGFIPSMALAAAAGDDVAMPTTGNEEESVKLDEV